jgi:hypothetical protein
MANYGPASVFIVVDGSDVTGDSRSLNETREEILEESRTLGDSREEFTPIGVAKATLEQGLGLYDDRTFGLIAAYQSSTGIPTGSTAQRMVYGVSGAGTGKPCVMLDGMYASKFGRQANKDGLTMATVTHTVSGALRDARLTSGSTSRSGVTGNTKSAPYDHEDFAFLRTIVDSNADDSVSTNNTTQGPNGFSALDRVFIAGHTGSTPDINGNQEIATIVDVNNFTLTGVNISAGGTGGTVQKVSAATGTAHLHVTALSLGGYTSVTVLLETSHDASTWATLATFANVTAIGTSESKALTSLRRYTAISWTFNGAGSGPTGTFYVPVYRSA